MTLPDKSEKGENIDSNGLGNSNVSRRNVLKILGTGGATIGGLKEYTGIAYGGESDKVRTEYLE